MHPPIEAYGLRIERGGEVLVLSGDTARCDELVALGRGADLLVVDACASPSGPYGRSFLDRLHGFHADGRDAGGVAAAVGAGRLVLTHLLPGSDPGRLVSDAAWACDGEVRVGEDLVSYAV